MVFWGVAPKTTLTEVAVGLVQEEKVVMPDTGVQVSDANAMEGSRAKVK